MTSTKMTDRKNDEFLKQMMDEMTGNKMSGIQNG